jgi:rod shape-determining protein MreC
MKTRLVVIVILLLILTVLLIRNDERISDTLLGIINPLKQNYTDLTENLKQKSHSYIFQKESIEKLGKENRILRKRLLEQTHYIQQVQDIYEVLPKLSRLPVHNISITQTISYVKLNSFSRVILTKPKGLKEGRLYGLIQDKVVAGTAIVHNNQLYGYLTSDKKCRFSVFVGEKQAPGIATGYKANEMVVKFIPKWHKIKVGDKVVTSGLDHIFFKNIPVGKVTSIELQSSYKVAHIKTYNDIFHPKTFFLINDPQVTLTDGFDANNTHLKPTAIPQTQTRPETSNLTEPTMETNLTDSTISSIPSRIDQTQEETIEPEVPFESPVKPELSKKKKKRTNQKPKKPKNPAASTLDLF